MLRSKSVVPKVKSGGALAPVLPLVPIELPSVDKDKSMFLVFELKTRVGQPADSTKYKKHVRKFEEGTPQQWIDTLKDLDEIWTQNSMTGGTDRASTVRAVVKGESGVSFETALQDARSDEEGVVVNNITADHVTTALNAVTSTVFPHRALETQKLWMTRKMFKPADMTTRQTAAAINRLNNALPLFPNGTEGSKFTPQELIGLLEWSLPQAWRAKFDLDGYVPSMHPKMKLIEACEAIERNEVAEKPKSSDANSNKKVKFDVSKVKHKSDQKGSARKTASYYCTEHGKNSTHSTSDCRVLKHKTGSTDKDTKRSFSNKAFRKEINLLAKNPVRRRSLICTRLLLSASVLNWTRRSHPNARLATTVTAIVIFLLMSSVKVLKGSRCLQGHPRLKPKPKPQWLRIRLLERLMMSLLRNSSIRKGSSGLKTTEKKARFCLKVQTQKNQKTICLNDWHP